MLASGQFEGESGEALAAPSAPAPGAGRADQAIVLTGVSHVAGERQVLADLSLRLDERRIGIIGRNGSGKSTLARCLNGLTVPQRGRVLVDGLDTASSGRAVRRRVGYVFQNADHQLIMPTVAEDIGFGLRSLKRSPEQSAIVTAAILEAFGVAHLAHRPVSELSGGEKRLITLLGVLVMAPRYLVLDEPMGGLDLYQRRRFAERIDGLAQNVIMITHDFEHLSGFDRVLALHEGRVVLDGPPDLVTARWTARYA